MRSTKMSELNERIFQLADEILVFPLSDCSPSDESEKRSAYLYSFLDIAKRFIGSIKRLDNDLLNKELVGIDTDIQFIIEAYDLKAKLVNIIDLVTDLRKQTQGNIGPVPLLSPQVASKLLNIIIDDLTSESANVLATICQNYGLGSGERAEAFKSKYNYVHSRTAHLEPSQILELAYKMQGKYANKQLETMLADIGNGENQLNVISQFDNIKSLLSQEILQAKYSIWIAVAWFTDKDLANLLYKKSKQGINVQIILNDNKINSLLSGKLSDYFETYLVPPQMKKLMHNKFCVIDLKTVIHGSYNWTNQAQYNNETISLVHNRSHAEEFADQFIKLKLEINQFK